MPAPGNPKGTNHRKGRGQGRKVVPEIRGAFMRALKILEDKGRPLSTILVEQMEEKPLETLAAISRFIPREMLVEHEAGETILAFAFIPRKEEPPAIEGEVVDAEVVQEIPRIVIPKQELPDVGD